MQVTRLATSPVQLRGVTSFLRALPLLFAAVLVVVVASRVLRLRRAAHVLTLFSEPDSKPSPGVTETPGERPFPLRVKDDDQLRWIEYRPAHPRGALLLVHGVNYKGMHEPRLVRFARALSSEGYVVVTPELPELADYRIAAPSIDRIGLVARDLAEHEGHPVGIVGTSFAGGLSVMTAARPEFAGSVRFVFSLGGHEDVDRVSRYLASGAGEGPDGAPVAVAPHDYGMLVLLHSHAARFFPPAEVNEAEEALTAWLHEDREVARTHLAKLGDAALRDHLTALMEHGERGPWTAQVLADLDAHRDESRSVSPSAVLPQVACPLFLLHGTGDSVIPAIETEYLTRDAPRVVWRSLVSPAIVHVEVGKGPNQLDQLALVDFLADVLAEAERR